MTAQVSAALTWPVLGATAVTVGLLVLLAGRVVGPVVSVAHEGGHMAIGFLTGGKVEYFRLKPDSVNAETKFDRLPGWLGDILTTFAGYVTPPLLGLGGAVLLKEGYAWPLLWIAVILFFVVWVIHEGAGPVKSLLSRSEACFLVVPAGFEQACMRRRGQGGAPGGEAEDERP